MCVCAGGWRVCAGCDACSTPPLPPPTPLTHTPHPPPTRLPTPPHAHRYWMTSPPAARACCGPARPSRYVCLSVCVHGAGACGVAFVRCCPLALAPSHAPTRPPPHTHAPTHLAHPPTPSHVQPQCDQTERWYGTRYSAAPLPPDWLAAWEGGEAPPELRLPDPNPFIPKTFDLIEVGGVCLRAWACVGGWVRWMVEGARGGGGGGAQGAPARAACRPPPPHSTHAHPHSHTRLPALRSLWAPLQWR